MMQKLNLERIKFLFDLNGYLVIKNVLSKEELESANKAIDRHKFHERKEKELRNSKENTIFSGDEKKGRLDMGGMLGWEKPDREVFRQFLNHPKLIEYLHLLLGPGYRLDHSPMIIAQEKGSEGFSLHGGSIDIKGQFTPELQYQCRNNQIYNTLLAVSFQLTEQSQGAGGFCVVPGSHKINFKPDYDMLNGNDEYFKEHCVKEIVTNAGDVVIFSEATIHGCLPWNANYQRRVALYRFAPSTIAFARGYSQGWPQQFLQGMTKEQLAIMQMPFNNFYDRNILNLDASINQDLNKRPQYKKDFDILVFGEEYY